MKTILYIALIFILIDNKKDLNAYAFLEETQKMRAFLKSNPKYNSEIVFLIDMKIPSSKNRFFIYNLKKTSL